jgi:DNA-binding winged helix-turn-helix (wHTH) protein
MPASFQQSSAHATVENTNDLAGPRTAWGFARRVDPAPAVDFSPTEFRFGGWCLVPAARLLLRDGRPAEIGGRAFDLLHLLLTRRGTVVEKNAIVAFVWPHTIVDESNLRFQMAALRKTLGTDRSFIKTIPGRGYIFAAEYDPRPSGRASSTHALVM